MDADLIDASYTQFKSKWGVDPEILFINGFLDYTQTIAPIEVFIILTEVNELTIKSVLLNANIPDIREVHVITNNLNVKNSIPHAKVSFIEFNKTYGITLNNITSHFNHDTINVLFFDNVGIDPHKIANFYFVNKSRVGILSANIFNDPVPSDILSYTEYSCHANDSMCKFNGLIIHGKIQVSLDYYTHIYGFQNLAIQSLEQVYDVVNMSSLIPTYLFFSNCTETAENNYITSNFNISFPIICARFADIVADIKVDCSDELIFDELYLPPPSCASYTLTDKKLLCVKDQIELNELKTFLKYKYYTDYKKQYDATLKTSLDRIEGLKELALEKITTECNTKRAEIIKSNNDLRERMRKDLQAEQSSSRTKHENDMILYCESIVKQKELEVSKYEIEQHERIDKEFSEKLASKFLDIDNVVNEKKDNEFAKLNVYAQSYMESRMNEQESILEKVMAEKQKDIDNKLEFYYNEKTEEHDLLLKCKLEEGVRKLEEYAQAQQVKISSEISIETRNHYQERYAEEIINLERVMLELRKSRTRKLNKDILLKETIALLEVQALKRAKQTEVNTFIDNYKQSRLSDVDAEISETKQVLLSNGKLGINIELSEFKNSQLDKVKVDIDNYDRELRYNITQRLKLYTESLKRDSETAISEYEKRRILEIDASATAKTKEVFENKLAVATSHLDEKVQSVYGEMIRKVEEDAKRKRLRVENEITVERETLFRELNTQITTMQESEQANIEILKKTLMEAAYTEHESYVSNLKEEYKEEYARMKENVCKQIASDLAKIKEEESLRLIDEIDSKFNARVEHHTNTQEQLMKRIVIDSNIAKDRLVIKLNTEMSNLELDLKSKNLDVIASYKKEKQAELVKLEADAIVQHNKIIADLDDALTTYRDTSISGINDEVAHERDELIKEVKSEIYKTTKASIDSELLDEKTRLLRDNLIEIENIKQARLHTLEEELTEIKNSRLEGIQKELEDYKREQGKALLTKFSLLKK